MTGGPKNPGRSSPSVSSPLPNQTTRPCSRPMQISLRIIRWKQRTSVPTGSSMEVIVGLAIIHTGKLENWKTGKLECCGKWDAFTSRNCRRYWR